MSFELIYNISIKYPTHVFTRHDSFPRKLARATANFATSTMDAPPVLFFKLSLLSLIQELVEVET
ncbi:hypothetical protein JCM19231_2497 [Vibrio ishigakensis]|uniref:Uncharacterized protein n=1 Tax=Vibrio ishigakensis TaxID=1481914 RepID=A0A0B8NYW4_9VIBR|nr:hypothetical protein JCM19231_2497 [Vibrio ishigakensis]